MLTRLLGLWQPLEWQTLDTGLRWRPAEPVDARVTIVAITEDDLRTAIDYPITDEVLAQLVQRIQNYEPRVIGIDIFRDRPVGEGYEQLVTTFTGAENLVSIYKMGLTPVDPPSFLPEEQTGFADAVLDHDGALRRSLLGSTDESGIYRFSLTIQAVAKYLEPEGLILENGIRDPETMRFGDTEIPRFYGHTGGYVGADSGGNQTLINFRAGSEPFTKISYKQLMAGDVDPELLADRLVLVGYIAESVKDFITSNALAGVNPSLVPGIDIQAHAASQILNAVYDARPFLHTVPEAVDYGLIVLASLGGVALACWRRQPLIHLVLVVAVAGTGMIISYGLLTVSWWLPLVPALGTFVISSTVLYPLYQAQAQLRSQLNERQQLVDWTWNTIHNGPLQDMAAMLRDWPETEPPPALLRQSLVDLNYKTRDIYNAMRQEMLLSSGKLVFTGQRSIDLDRPLAELLQEVYQITLERNRQFFEPLLKIVSFKPMGDKRLSSSQKRKLGRFLEEALLNIPKHAADTTRLTIVCREEQGVNLIRVQDNGSGTTQGPAAGSGGDGTRQAKALARSLGGRFERTPAKPKGMRCELRWPTRGRWWQQRN